MFSHSIMRGDIYDQEKSQVQKWWTQVFSSGSGDYTRISCKDTDNIFFKKNEGNQCHFDLFHFPERRVRNSICFSKVNVQLGYRKFRQSESGKFFVFSKYRWATLNPNYLLCQGFWCVTIWCCQLPLIYVMF